MNGGGLATILDPDLPAPFEHHTTYSANSKIFSDTKSYNLYKSFGNTQKASEMMK